MNQFLGLNRRFLIIFIGVKILNTDYLLFCLAVIITCVYYVIGRGLHISCCPILLAMYNEILLN